MMMGTQRIMMDVVPNVYLNLSFHVLLVLLPRTVCQFVEIQRLWGVKYVMMGLMMGRDVPLVVKGLLQDMNVLWEHQSPLPNVLRYVKMELEQKEKYVMIPQSKDKDARMIVLEILQVGSVLMDLLEANQLVSLFVETE